MNGEMGDDAAAGKVHGPLDGGTADRNILHRLAHGFSVCTGGLWHPGSVVGAVAAHDAPWRGGRGTGGTGRSFGWGAHTLWFYALGVGSCERMTLERRG